MTPTDFMYLHFLTLASGRKQLEYHSFHKGIHHTSSATHTAWKPVSVPWARSAAHSFPGTLEWLDNIFHLHQQFQTPERYSPLVQPAEKTAKYMHR